MDVIKYFFEEPASLEPLSPALDPDARRTGGPAMTLDAFLQGPTYYRGYLAGTSLPERRVGLTALSSPEAFLEPLLDALRGTTWTHGSTNDEVAPVPLDHVREVLQQPTTTRLLAAGPTTPPSDLLREAAGPEHRYHLPALRALLDRGYDLLLPEPAHHGYDWSLFSASPLRPRLEDAFRRHLHEGVLYYLIPYRAARSEEKFYFDLYDPDYFARYRLA